jgi:hypothetical protein
MSVGPREINTPFRPIPLDVPEGMKPNEFFNSPENLADLTQNNGLLTNNEDLLLYRKALGHSNEFACSIIYNTSQRILNPLGRPVRRTQLPNDVRKVWNRMNQIVIGFMLEEYPDPSKHLVLAGEASLDSTWPITSAGVPSIRMLHNHFIVFDKSQLKAAKLADNDNPNLTDGGQHSLFSAYMQDVYVQFLSALDLEILRPIAGEASSLSLTGYPQGLPSWEILGGIDSLKNIEFWKEYDLVLKGFLDFYRTFFAQVSSRNSGVPKMLTSRKRLKTPYCSITAFYRQPKKCVISVLKMLNMPLLFAGNLRLNNSFIEMTKADWWLPFLKIQSVMRLLNCWALLLNAHRMRWRMKKLNLH